MSEEYDEEKFLRDLEELSPTKLRAAYPKESRSHAGLKRRVAEGHFELDPAWERFVDFLRDMGPAPTSDASVDRIDNDNRRYGPGLCRWAGKKEQTRNRSNTIWIDWDDRKLTLGEFAEEIQMNYQTVYSAYHRGETPEEIASRSPAFAVDPNSTRPSWIKDDDMWQVWSREYIRWRRHLRRNAQKSASIDLFYAIRLSEMYQKALSVRAIDEMTPDEFERARQGKYGPQIRLRAHGLEWIEEALKRLATTDRALAARLWPSRAHELHKYEEALLPEPANH